MDCSPPDSSVHETSQARIPEWVVISFPEGSSRPRDRTCISCIGRRILYYWVTQEAGLFEASLNVYPNSCSIYRLSPPSSFFREWGPLDCTNVDLHQPDSAKWCHHSMSSYKTFATDGIAIKKFNKPTIDTRTLLDPLMNPMPTCCQKHLLSHNLIYFSPCCSRCLQVGAKWLMSPDATEANKACCAPSMLSAVRNLQLT